MREVDLAVEPLRGALAVALGDAPRGDGSVRAYWLGQAGFVLAHGEDRVVIDPYLSDHLARKYAGQELAHRRMAPAPIAPAELTRVSLVLCTHRHSDHMDPETLPALAAANPGAGVVVPLAERGRALAMGVPARQLRPLDAGERLDAGGVSVEAIPSAHEDLTTDAEGRCVFLGYALRLGGLTFYHSGDCVPYDGLAERLRGLDVDVALLPVNGRDAYRASRGVPGNFEVGEAVALCAAAGVRVLVGHHHGMFEFNTVDPALAGRVLAEGFAHGIGLLARSDAALRFARRAGAPRRRVGP
jgi:L-ascorbate metabolism protein UlaG (beta-lactamase superfamily)